MQKLDARKIVHDMYTNDPLMNINTCHGSNLNICTVTKLIFNNILTVIFMIFDDKCHYKILFF